MPQKEMLGKKPKSFGYYNQEVVGLNTMELKQSETLFCTPPPPKKKNTLIGQIKNKTQFFSKRYLIVTLKSRKRKSS